MRAGWIMAKKNAKDEKKLSYSQELKLLRDEGPQRLYLLYGPEDYLREQFLLALKKLCLPEGEDDFSYKRLDGPELDVNALAGAIDAVPFMTERSFVELRGVDINKVKDADAAAKILTDIPDYCTVAFVQSAQYEPDGRLKLIKAIRANGHDMKFTQQSQGQLVDWITRRFAAAGKSADMDAVQSLIFISGDLMSRLIPEIEGRGIRQGRARHGRRCGSRGEPHPGGGRVQPVRPYRRAPVRERRADACGASGGQE